MKNSVSRKKLLITASTLPRYDGDTEPRFVLDLAKELSKYYNVTILAPTAPEAKCSEVLEGVHVERYHYFPVHSLETLCYPGAIVPRIREKKIRVLLVPFLFLGLLAALWKRRNDYDMVHANWFIPQGIVQCLFKTPYVVTGHGGDVTSLNMKPVSAMKRNAVKKASYVTVVSHRLKDELLRIMPEREQQELSEKICVAPMGCDTTRFSPKYRVNQLWKQGDRKVILFVGRLAEKKGVRYLIEAMRWVDAQLVIVGKGPLQDELKHMTKSLQLDDKVVFEGAKNHDELPAIYASADVFAAPSVTAKDNDKEGFGLVILEAMASGLPVVASRSGGIVEIIEDGVNGSLVEEKNAKGLSEALNRMLEDTEYREICKKNMRVTVERYSYENVGKKYRDIFDTIMR